MKKTSMKASRWMYTKYWILGKQKREVFIAILFLDIQLIFRSKINFCHSIQVNLYKMHNAEPIYCTV